MNMIWFYSFTIIWCLVLLCLLLKKYYDYYKLKSGNIKIDLLLDENNVLTFVSPFNAEKCIIYKYEHNIKINDLMTGVHYVPGFKQIKCNKEEDLKKWKTKLNTFKKILEFENKEFEKYNNEIKC